MIRLTHEPIDYYRLTEEVRRPGCGGVVTFLGTVRDLTGEQVTVALDYQAYPAMAEKKMAEREAKGDAMVKEEVDDELVAQIVAKWTGIPVSRLVEGERELVLVHAADFVAQQYHRPQRLLQLPQPPDLLRDLQDR